MTWALEYECGCVTQWTDDIEGSGFSGMVYIERCAKHPKIGGLVEFVESNVGPLPDDEEPPT